MKSRYLANNVIQKTINIIILLINNYWGLFLSGLLAGCIFAPISFLPSAMMFSVYAYVIYNENHIKALIKKIFFFSYGFFLIALYWISCALFIDIKKYILLFFLALFGIPFVISTFHIFIALIAFYFRKSYFFHIILCVIYLFCEYLLTFIFTGFPWSLLGYSLADHMYFAQSASIFGVFGQSFVILYIGAMGYLLIDKLNNGLKDELNNEKKQRNITLFKSKFLISLMMIVTLFYYGYYRLKNNPTEYKNIVARIVQPSFVKNNRWSESIFFNKLDRYIELSRAPLSRDRLEFYDNDKESQDIRYPDIIIWPESAVTVSYLYSDVYYHLMKLFKDKNFHDKNEQLLIFGGVREDRKDNIYTSMIALENKGNIVFEYDKSHLVPFGEYIPFKSFFPFVEKLTSGAMDYSQGVRKNVRVKINNKYNPELEINILPLICYEAIFPNEILSIYNNDLDLIVNITNDSWYYNSSGPYQHLAINKMRAIETGLPLFRATLTGVSAIYDGLGREIGRLNMYESGSLDSKIPHKVKKQTIFTKYQYNILILLIITVVVFELLVYIILKFLEVKIEIF